MHYVYLIKSQKRLIVCNQAIKNDDYHFLLNSTNEQACNAYCVGFIYGNEYNQVVINKAIEFI